MNHEQQRATIYDRLALIAIALWTLVGMLYIFYGRYVGDEGWYALISREVWHGKILYRDFRFTQMPLLPYVYGTVLAWSPPRLEFGRGLSLLFCLSGVWACWRLTRARYGASAAFYGLMVLLLHRAFPYDGTNIKTQPLSFALVAWALYFIERSNHKQTRDNGESRNHPSASIIIAGLLFSAAVLCRLSLLPSLILFPIYLWLKAHPITESPPKIPRTLIRPGLWASWLPVITVVVMFSFIAEDRFYFSVWGFHKLIGQGLNFWSNLTQFLQGIIKDMLPWSLMILSGFCYWGYAITRRNILQASLFRGIYHLSFESLVLLLWLLCTIIHATRQPAYHVYQMTLAWAPMIISSWLTATLMKKSLRWYQAAFFPIIVMSLLTMPFQDGWLHFNGWRTPKAIYNLAQPLRAAPGKTLAGFDSGLAFCAPKIKLLPGYEMSEFSLISPSDPKAQEYYRGINARQLINDIDHRADFIAIRKHDLQLLPMAVRPTILQHLFQQFKVLHYVRGYGQRQDSLWIGQRK